MCQKNPHAVNWTQDDVYPGDPTTGQSELRNIFDPKLDRKPRLYLLVHSATACMVCDLEDK